MKFPPYPPIAEPLQETLRSCPVGTLPNSPNASEVAPVVVLGGNYRGIFGQLRHRVPLVEMRGDSIRVIRICDEAEPFPGNVPGQVGSEIGLFASCGSELLGVVAASVWCQLFVWSGRIAKQLFRIRSEPSKRSALVGEILCARTRSKPPGSNVEKVERMPSNERLAS